MVELIAPVTGWDMDWAEGIDTAKRILTPRQAFNTREGIDMETFHLPKRFLEPLVAGPAAGGTPSAVRDLAGRLLRGDGLGRQDRST